MSVNVPIDWNDNKNLTTCTETVKIFLKRYFISENKNIAHQLWRIAGDFCGKKNQYIFFEIYLFSI